MRHFPFPIDQQARDHWLQHMLEALDEVGIGDPMHSEMRVYFERASTHMINKETLMNETRLRQLLDSLIAYIIRLPRAARIGLALLFAVALTLLVTPIIDAIYVSRFFDSGTAMLPSIISTAFGLVFYFVGWRLMVGFAGETPAPRRALLWYVGAGTLVSLLRCF